MNEHEPLNAAPRVDHVAVFLAAVNEKWQALYRGDTRSYEAMMRREAGLYAIALRSIGREVER